MEMIFILISIIILLLFIVQVTRIDLKQCQKDIERLKEYILKKGLENNGK